MVYRELLLGLLIVIMMVTLTTDKETQMGMSTVLDSDSIQELKSSSGGFPTGTKYLVHPSNIQSGGPPKDGIPSIDDPKFTSVDDADQWIEDNELVLGIIYKGEERVYPLQILVWHEIVNDVIGEDPILITYCPLCGSGIAFERLVNGNEVEFGTSGKLWNSNLVMYDRLTNTYWTQIDGRAIVGELTGTELTPVSIDTVAWREWKVSHPNSRVLTRETGHSRPYGEDPYGSYYEDSILFFPVNGEDNRIHPKDVVFGVEINDKHKAYRETDLLQTPVINDIVDGVPIVVERLKDGRVVIARQDNGEEIIKERDFWFAWYAFHPETELYGF